MGAGPGGGKWWLGSCYSRVRNLQEVPGNAAFVLSQPGAANLLSGEWMKCARSYGVCVCVCMCEGQLVVAR